MWDCLYVLLAWTGALTALNQASGDYAVAFLLVFCVVAVCIGIGLRRIGPLVWFLGYALFLSGSIYIVVPSPETSPFALVGCVTTLSIVLYVVLQARLSMQRELKAARKEAKMASRLKSALLANMNHEVRTPLTSILGFAELIADAEPDDPGALADNIRRSGRRLLDTLDAVLQASQLESGAVDLEPKPLDLASVTANRVEALQPVADENDIHLECSRPAAPVEAQVDADAMEQIIDELVHNAIDFSEPGDCAQVRVEDRFEHVMVTVEDTGAGMQEENLDELLRPFEQASVGRDRTHEGTGLGLTTVHHLVQLLDGEIDLKSEKGEGTRITVTVPQYRPVTSSARGLL
jgi:signal transduction histidine kinase